MWPRNFLFPKRRIPFIENSQNGVVAQHIKNLSKLYNVTTDFILKGDKLLIQINQKNGFIPLVKAHAHADFVNYPPDAQIYEESDWFKIPGLNPTLDGKLFEIEGDIMSPTLFNGDIVICQTQKDISKILDGSLVLIITADGVFAKRLRLVTDDTYLILESDNQQLIGKGEKKIKKSEIMEAMAIRGKISSVLVPHHEIVSKGVLKAMEESIEFLKKKLYKMNKKLSALKN